MLCSGVLFCNIYWRQQAHTPAGIIISRVESISRGSGRFARGRRYELSHDFKRNPIFIFSANKRNFSVLWKKWMPKKIIYLAQTTLESKSHRRLPTHQLLLKTFFICLKTRKISVFFNVHPYVHIFEGESSDLLKK